VHLCFREEVEARLVFGLRRRLRHLDLYVDEPDAFASAISDALENP